MSEWKIFTGKAGEGAAPTKFPAPPPWRVPGPTREAVLGATFQSTDGLIEAVNAAIYLSRPLLLTGKPGGGKSSLIYAVARELALGNVLSWPINSRSNLRDALYTYDALGRLQFMQDREAEARAGKLATVTATDIGPFITLGALGTALAATKGRRALLVDEIDKSDVDLPNDLLNVLDTGKFRIPELQRMSVGSTEVLDAEGSPVTVTKGEVAFTSFPFVVMTSNGERDFPAPFLRRCVRFDVPEQTPEQLQKIVLAHFNIAVDDTDVALPGDGEGGLLTKFVNLRKDLPSLSTDQLLNAMHMMRAATFTEEEKKSLIARLFQELR